MEPKLGVEDDDRKAVVGEVEMVKPSA